MIFNTLKIFGAVIFVLFFLGNQTLGQNITSNDGFEGNTAQGIPPKGWNNCDDGFSTVDTQPGIFSNYIAASEGNTYISMVTRKDGQPGTVETVWANLLTPFEKDKCYNLSLEISLTSQFFIDNWGTLYYFSSPCVLQIIGFNGDCDSPSEVEVLWESNVLENYGWETFDMTIMPSIATFENIALRPNFTTPNNHQNSAALVDHLRFRNSTKTFTYENGLFKIPESATDIKWFFNGQIVENASTLEMPIMGNGEYKATFFDENGCFAFAVGDFYMDLESIKIYPNPTKSKITIDHYSLTNENCTIYIHDDLGKLVYEYDFMQVKGLNKTNLDLSFLAPAVYYLRIKKTDLKNDIHKIVIGQ